MKILSSIKRQVFFTGSILIVLSAILPGPLLAKALRVAVIPFQVNAEKDFSFLQKGIVDMLISRLSWEDKVSVISREETQAAMNQDPSAVNENTARKLGARLSADYVLYGSLTIFGSSVSMDAKILDVSGKSPALSFFNESRGMDEVLPRINLIAQEINEKIFNRKSAERPLAPAQGTQAPNIYTHPEKLFENELSGGASGQGSSFIVSQQDGKASLLKRSRNFNFQISGIALGDLDGDNKTETVLLTENKIFIYRFQDGQMLQLKEIDGKPHLKFFSVDVADIKPDGRAEIFVSVMNTVANNLESFVLEWNGNDFALLASNENWFFKTLNLPKRGTVLFGQRKGLTELYGPGVFELSWNGRQYSQQSKIYLPNGVNIFNFSLGNFLARATESLVILDSSDYLGIFSLTGKKEWVSDQKFGGNEKYLASPFVEDAEKDRGSETLHYLPQRLLVVDLNRDGINEVIVVKNDSFTGRVLDRYRQFNKTQFEALSWNGQNLQANWNTREMSGYISDYAIGDLDNDGRMDLVAANVSGRESLLAKGKSALLYFDLEAAAAKTQ
ncbi:MAG: CsgG/HfaB family protein [Desulfobacterales bacterium]|nr:CsgG/HfaB family protein [Desulfobacterales bacterium]